MKNCISCNIIKPMNDFGKKAASKDDNLKKSNKFCHSISTEFFEIVKSYISEYYIKQIVYI